MTHTPKMKAGNCKTACNPLAIAMYGHVRCVGKTVLAYQPTF
jgi:hypothetical protein